jgi:hypothetical protein
MISHKKVYSSSLEILLEFTKRVNACRDGCMIFMMMMMMKNISTIRTAEDEEDIFMSIVGGWLLWIVGLHIHFCLHFLPTFLLSVSSQSLNQTDTHTLE